jgi:site-specific DNA recombinase
VFVDRRACDTELLTFIVERLSDERHALEVAAAKSRVHERLAAAEKEIREVEKLQAAVSERLGKRRMSLEAFDIANEPLVADLARLAAERDALAATTVAGPTQVESASTLERDWVRGDVAEKRAMLTRAIGPDKLCVLSGSRIGKRTFDRERIKLRSPEEFAMIVAAWNAKQGRGRMSHAGKATDGQD